MERFILVSNNNSEKKTSADETRIKAQKARIDAEKQEKRRENMMRFGIGAGVLVVVAGIIGAAVVSTSGKDNPNPTPSGSVSSALPLGVTKDNLGAATGTAKTPVIDVFEDFQCPACATIEKAYGETINNLANTGKAKVSYYPMDFLDNNLKNDSSQRATSAFGCAVDADKTQAYHSIVFKNQPAQEGVGYTQEQLTQFGKDAGITGEAFTKFSSCVDNLTYNGWGSMVNETATQRGVRGTPTYFVNGKEIPRDAFTSEASFLAKINELAGKPAS